MREILEETQNRELSWLRFNQRVLEEARDETVPLMERMKFVAIFTSNLDEFFMIRVGSLYDMASADSKKIDQRSGMTAKQQLDAIYRAVILVLHVDEGHKSLHASQAGPDNSSSYYR